MSKKTSEGENKYFNEALRDFTFDMACGAAIRHLTDLGYTAEKIASRLDYPVPLEKIRAYMDRYIQTSAEDKTNTEGRYEMVREYDEYGRSSYRRVEKKQK